MPGEPCILQRNVRAGRLTIEREKMEQKHGFAAAALAGVVLLGCVAKPALKEKPESSAIPASGQVVVEAPGAVQVQPAPAVNRHLARKAVRRTRADLPPLVAAEASAVQPTGTMAARAGGGSHMAWIILLAVLAAAAAYYARTRRPKIEPLPLSGKSGTQYGPPPLVLPVLPPAGGDGASVMHHRQAAPHEEMVSTAPGPPGASKSPGR